jgi:hypothetical protein
MLPNDGQLILPKAYACVTEQELCYREFSADDFSNPPFPLILHPFSFLAVQIPAIRPTEQHLLNWIDPSNSRIGHYLLDLLSYERLFLSRLEVLRTQVIPRAKESFPVLDNEFMISLTFLCMVHRKWLNELENTLQSGDRGRVGEVVLALGQLTEIKGAEKDYARHAGALTTVIAEASLKYSSLFTAKLGNETILQVAGAPSRWKRHVAVIAKGLLAALEGNASVAKTARAPLAAWLKNQK